MKAQSAIEFLSIVALGLILLIGTSFIGYNYVRNYFFDTNVLNARQMVGVTTSASNLLYSQGINASTKVKIIMPYDIVKNRTYIHDKEINIRFGEPAGDVVNYAATDMYGSIPLKPGSNMLYLKMTPDGIKIKVDDEKISFIDINTYSDSGCTAEEDEFSSGETHYYKAKAEYFNGTGITGTLDFYLYAENETLLEEGSVSITGGVSGCLGSVLYPSGNHLYSVYAPDEKIVGTSIVKIS